VHKTRLCTVYVTLHSLSNGILSVGLKWKLSANFGFSYLIQKSRFVATTPPKAIKTEVTDNMSLSAKYLIK